MKALLGIYLFICLFTSDSWSTVYDKGIK